MCPGGREGTFLKKGFLPFPRTPFLSSKDFLSFWIIDSANLSGKVLQNGFGLIRLCFFARPGCQKPLTLTAGALILCLSDYEEAPFLKG